MGRILVLGGVLAVLLWVAWLSLAPDDAGIGSLAGPPLAPAPADDGPAVQVAPGPESTREPRPERLTSGPAGVTTPAQAAAVEPRPATSLTVHVRHADGAPAPDARVALTHGDQLLTAGRAGQQLQLAAAVHQLAEDTQLQAWVAGTSDRILSLPVLASALDAPTLDLDLPRGLALEARVLLDGAPLNRPLDLALLPRREFRSEVDAPTAVVAALELPDCDLAQSLRPVAVRVRPPGRVRWSSLPAGWNGTLRFADTLLCTGEGCSRERDAISLQAPGRGLTLELLSCPTISGRALLPDGSPAVAAEVAVLLEHMIIQRDRPAVTTDATGAFAVPCHWDPNWLARLTFTSADGDAAASRAVADTHRERGAELGDVWLEPLQGVELLTVAPDGRPIAGAVVLPLSDGEHVDAERASPPTDSDGRTRLEITRDDPGASVQALRHASTRLPAAALAAGVPQPVVVTMQPCARLLLSVDRGTYEGKLSWQLRGEQALFDDAEGTLGPGPGRLLVGVPRSTGNQSMWVGSDPPTLSGTVSFAAADGPVLLSCLVPGVSFDVELTTSDGYALWSREDLVLPAGEETALHARLGEVTERVVWGRVVDPQGRPVADAQLYVERIGARSSGGWLSHGADSDAEGAFRFDPLPDVELALDVAALGYLPQLIEPAPRGELVIVLVPEG